MAEEVNDDEPAVFRELAVRMGYIYSDEVYSSFFGLTPETTCTAWDVISTPTVHPRLLPKHLLWALLFLKQYGNERILASIAKTTPKTYRKWIWIVLEGLCSRYSKVVSETYNYLFYFILFILFFFILFYSILFNIDPMGKQADLRQRKHL